MKKLNFDKKIFNWGYAYLYTLLQCVSAPGFIAMTCIVVLSAAIEEPFVIPIPEAIFLPTVAYGFVSFISFPIISVIKVGYKRLVVGSTVTYDHDTITYDKLAEYHWTAVGHVEEHHLYTVSAIDSVTATKFSYVLKGNIEKVVINNGRKLSEKRVSVVKIPNAYAAFPRFSAEALAPHQSSDQ